MPANTNECQRITPRQALKQSLPWVLFCLAVGVITLVEDYPWFCVAAFI